MMWFWRLLGWRCYEVGYHVVWIRGPSHPEWEQHVLDMVKTLDRHGGAEWVYDYKGSR